MRMRGRSDRPCCLCTCEQITSQVRHPMHSVGSGKMTPLANGVGLGEAPAARLIPPMASNAINAPTAAVAPFRTLRRVAPESPADDVVPSLTIRSCSPPLAAPTSDHDAFDQHPEDGQAAKRQNVRTDP